MMSSEFPSIWLEFENKHKKSTDLWLLQGVVKMCWQFSKTPTEYMKNIHWTNWNSRSRKKEYSNPWGCQRLCPKMGGLRLFSNQVGNSITKHSYTLWTEHIWHISCWQAECIWGHHWALNHTYLSFELEKNYNI
jgi:hypothetical protein